MIEIVKLNSGNEKENAERIVRSLRDYSCVIIQDPRTTAKDNDAFISAMESYFNQKESVKMNDARPNMNYQIGYTPAKQEISRGIKSEKCAKYISNLTEENKCALPKKNQPDLKSRFFWRIGSRPENTQFPDLNGKKQVIPKGIPDFEETMNKWGNSLMETLRSVIILLGIGLKYELRLPKNDEEIAQEFLDLIKDAPHLLAPTGSCLRNAKRGDILAGIHADMNFLTIHGKSNFPGLEIWDKNGKKIRMSIPEDCLLIQAGDQLEICTGGYIKAGYHQVTVTEATEYAIERKRLLHSKEKHLNKPFCPWRVSSTLFCHVASDLRLKNLIAETDDNEKGILSGDYIKQHLKDNNL